MLAQLVLNDKICSRSTLYLCITDCSIDLNFLSNVSGERIATVVVRNYE